MERQLVASTRGDGERRVLHTVNVEDVSLDDVFVALGVAGVVAGVNQSNVVDVEGSVREDFEFLFGQLSQVESVSSPDDRRSWRSSHVAFDFNIVTDSG